MFLTIHEQKRKRKLSEKTLLPLSFCAYKSLCGFAVKKAKRINDYRLCFSYHNRHIRKIIKRKKCFTLKIT